MAVCNDGYSGLPFAACCELNASVVFAAAELDVFSDLCSAVSILKEYFPPITVKGLLLASLGTLDFFNLGCNWGGLTAFFFFRGNLN